MTTVPPDVPSPEFWTNAGLFLAAVAAAIWAYLKKPSPAPPPVTPSAAVITGVGMELGSREQMTELIKQVKRIADALEQDEKDEFKETADRLLAELARQERR